MSTFIKHIIKFSFFFILFFSAIQLWAQDTIPVDTTVIHTDSTNIVVEAPELDLPDSIAIPKVSPAPKAMPDSLRKSGFVSGLEIGIDYLKFAGLLLKSETKYEGSLGIIFKNKYVLDLEVGEAVLTPSNAYRNATFYKSEGRYYRIGLNYLLISNEKNLLSAGVRYGHSKFSEYISYRTENVFGFTYEDSENKENLKANWYELTLTTEGAVIKNIYAGAIIRFRILGNVTDEGTFGAFSIPGYGRGIDKTIPAFNLFIRYRLNF